MKIEDFKREFKKLQSRYPNFDIPDVPAVLMIYFETLWRFNLEVVKRACARAARMSPNFFPALGLLENCCEAVRDEIELGLKYPKPKFYPHDHGCGLDGKRVNVSGARRLLFQMSPYEGLHILCRSNRPPRCPWCGIDVAPFENPFHLQLMRSFPGETRGWNPAMKGTILCRNCEKLNYPSDFLKPTHA